MSKSADSAPDSRFLPIAALAVALAALAGSLALSLALDLKACPLCFYQRTFAMSVVSVLTMGLVLDVGRHGRLSLLALPLATSGLGVALFHVFLELTNKLECPAGVFGLGSAPQQSLAAFAILFGLLLTDTLRGINRGVLRQPIVAAAVVLGALLAIGSTIANPPPVRPGVYDFPTKTCRPPQP